MKFKNIAEMERYAKNEESGTCLERSRTSWLEVRWNEHQKEFMYKFGKRYVSRMTAASVLLKR